MYYWTSTTSNVLQLRGFILSSQKSRNQPQFLLERNIEYLFPIPSIPRKNSYFFLLHGRYLLAISNPKNAAAFAGKARNMQGAKPTNSPLQPSVVRMCRNVEDIPRYMLPSDEAIIRFFTTSKG